MDSWERFDERCLPFRREFYTNITLENITDIDYKHANKVFKNFSYEI